jgi:paraquat-inducible protein B
VTASLHRLAATVGLATILLLAATVPAGAASPKAWTTSVCGALDTWVTKVSAASATTTKTAPKSSVDAKKRLTKLLSTTQQQTKELLAEVTEAGKPDVKGGQQIAATMREGFAQVQRTVAQARRSLAQAPTSDPTTFMAAARTAQDALEAGLEGIQAAFSAARTADAAPLLKAFAANDDCQAVSA